MSEGEVFKVVKQNPQIIISCNGCKSKSITNNGTLCYCCTQDKTGEVKNETNIFLNHISKYLHKISQGNSDQTMKTKYAREKEDEFEYSKSLRNVKLKCASNCFGVQNKEPNTIIDDKIIEHNLYKEQEVNTKNLKKIENRKCLHVNVNFVNQVNLPGSSNCICNKRALKGSTQCNCNLEVQEDNIKALLRNDPKRSGTQYCIVISPEGETTIFYQNHDEKDEKKKKSTRDRVLKSDSEESLEKQEESSDEEIDEKLGSNYGTIEDIKDKDKEDLPQSLADLEGKDADYNNIENTGKDEQTRSSIKSSDKRETSEDDDRISIEKETEKTDSENAANTDFDSGIERSSDNISKELLDNSLEESSDQTEEKDGVQLKGKQNENDVLQQKSDETLEESKSKSERQIEEESIKERSDSALAHEGLESESTREESKSAKSDKGFESESTKEGSDSALLNKSHESGSTREKSSELPHEGRESETIGQEHYNDERLEKEEGGTEGSSKRLSESSQSIRRSSQSIRDLNEAKSSEIYSLAIQSIESAKINWTKDTEYLEKEVGKYLIKSMAEIGFVKPSDPLNYLGERLYKYRQMEDYRIIADAEKEDSLLNKEIFELTKQEVRKFNTLKRQKHKIKATDTILDNDSTEKMPENNDMTEGTPENNEMPENNNVTDEMPKNNDVTDMETGIKNYNTDHVIEDELQLNNT